MTAVAVAATGCAAGAVALATRTPAHARRRLTATLRTVTGPPASARPQRITGPRPEVAVIASLCLLGCVLGCLLSYLLGAGPTLALLAVVATVRPITKRVQIRAAERATSAATIELLRAVAAELRAGRLGGVAFAVAAEAAPEPLRSLVRPAAAVARRGDVTDLADALGTVVAPVSGASRRSKLRGSEGLARLVACWRVAAASGATLAPAIDRVADGLQDDVELRRALTAALAGPRATVRVLAALPLVGLLLATAVGAQPVAFLLGSCAGFGCLAAAGLFDAAGIGWARRIARRAQYRSG